MIPSRTPRCSEPDTSSGQNILIGEDRYVRVETIQSIEAVGAQQPSTVWITSLSGYKVRSERPIEDIVAQIEAFGYTVDKQGCKFDVHARPASYSQPDIFGP